MRCPSPNHSAWRRATAILLGLAALVAGCRTLDNPPPVVVKPGKHTVRDGNLVLISDFQLAVDDPLVADLVELREHVVATLKLPEPRQDVVEIASV